MPPTDDGPPAATPAPKSPNRLDASWLALIAAALVLGYIASAVWESNHPKPAATAAQAGDFMPWVSIAEASTVASRLIRGS